MQPHRNWKLITGLNLPKWYFHLKNGQSYKLFDKARKMRKQRKGKARTKEEEASGKTKEEDGKARAKDGKGTKQGKEEDFGNGRGSGTPHVQYAEARITGKRSAPTKV